MTLTTTLTTNKKSTHLMKDTQAIHRTLTHATNGTQHQWAQPDQHHLIVRHQHPIDWNNTLTGIITQAITTPTTTPITGAPITYGLIANPTWAQSQGHGQRSKRRALPPEQWNQWLERKLGDALNLHHIDCTALPTAIGKRHTTHTIHRRVLYTGEATVKNHEQLDKILHTGIGSGKAYGCGLLLTQETA